jgi:hypothetical protein
MTKPQQRLTCENAVKRCLLRSGWLRLYTATAAGYAQYAPKSAGVIVAAVFNGPVVGAGGYGQVRQLSWMIRHPAAFEPPLTPPSVM